MLWTHRLLIRRQCRSRRSAELIYQLRGNRSCTLLRYRSDSLRNLLLPCRPYPSATATACGTWPTLPWADPCGTRSLCFFGYGRFIIRSPWSFRRFPSIIIIIRQHSQTNLKRTHPFNNHLASSLDVFSTNKSTTKFCCPLKFDSVV